MVSTRGNRYKFAEGERVLCYEPDPTKAKVLYDSKVLEVMESKDRRGRRTVEYLIHFQGWNSSWDRCVGEDFVLKDTEENRQLQRDLADKSQLQLGAYLYRRERKKGGGSTSGGAGPAPPKRSRTSGSGTFEDEGSSSSTTQHEGEGEGEGVPGMAEPREGQAADGVAGVERERGGGGGGDATDSSSGGSRSGAGAPPPPPPHASGRVHITLPSALRDRLTFDYHLVVKRGRLSSLPASPCVADILESFVRWYARAGAYSPHASPRPNLPDVSRRLNLVREVADGLRVYFDSVLRGHLLYKHELSQYHDLVGRFIDSPKVKTEKEDSEPEAAGGVFEDAPDVKTEPTEPSEVKQEPAEPADEPMEQEEAASGGGDAAAAGDAPADKDAMEPDSTEVHVKVEDVPGVVSEAGKGEPVKCDRESGDGSARPHRKDKREVKPDSVARRLRSQKNSVTSVGEGSSGGGGGGGGSGSAAGDDAVPSTSHEQEPTTLDFNPGSVDSSGSSTGEPWCWRRRSAPRPLSPPRNPLTALLDKVANWSIIPRENTEHLPCRIYGAVHLSRLFVKLPDFLNAIHMPDMKLKLLLQYIDMFVRYLDEHSEWFGETYYMSDSTSRSH